LKKFGDIVKKTSDIFSWIAGGAIAVAMVLVVANVILRKIFKSPVLGVYEFTGFISVVIISFGLAYVLVVDAHIAVDFIVEKFKPVVRNVIDTIIGLIVLGFMSVFTWNSFIYATKVMTSNQLSPTTQTPFYIFIYAMSLCFVLLCLVYITKVRESLGKARSE
jgi:TRAP-type C4-dicarboxylate transport system permease small subunit